MSTEQLLGRFQQLIGDWHSARQSADSFRSLIANCQGDLERDVACLLEAEKAAARVYQELRGLHLLILVRISYRRYKKLAKLTGGPWF